MLAGELDGGSAVSRLPHHEVALLGEHLDEVQADERLVLGHDDATGLLGRAGHA